MTTCVNTPTPSVCTLNGKTIADGASYTFYQSPSVPYKSSCVGENRNCSDGTLSGGSSYQYASCAVDPAPPISDISITVDPKIVRSGNSVTITWDGGNAEACTVKGPALTANAVTGSQEVPSLQGEATYILECTLGPNSKSDTVTVRILPRIQET